MIDDYSWRLKIIFVHFARGLMPETEGMLDVSGVLLPLPDFMQIARIFGIAPQRMGVKAVTRFVWGYGSRVPGFRTGV